MRIRKVLLLAGLMLVISGCSTKIENTETAVVSSSITETTVEEETVPDSENVGTFIGNNNSEYTLIFGGNRHDITDYVLACESTYAVFNSQILSDIFGMQNKGVVDGFLVYEDENSVLQLEINGIRLIANEQVIEVGLEMSYCDEENIAVPMDVIFAMGYPGYATGRNENHLFFQLTEKDGTVIPENNIESISEKGKEDSGCAIK